MNSNINEKMLANLSVRLKDLPEIPCPCGSTRRAFSEISSGKVSLHLVEVKENSELHYHKKQTEIYYILSGSGEIEINRKIESDNQNIYSFVPFHGTPLRKMCEKLGLIDHDTITKCNTM